MTESLKAARSKLARVLEIYTPFGPARENAVAAMSASLTEFEEAVREDERAKSLDAIVKAQAEANEALARGAQHAATVEAFRAAEAARVTEPVRIPPVVEATDDNALPAPLGDESQAPADTQQQPKFDAEIPGVNAPAARNGRKRGG